MMISIKAWATQTLTWFSRCLANAFDFDSAQPPTTSNTWNAETLANFGLELGKGLGPGL